MIPGAEPLAEVTRRDEQTGRELVESSHLGHVVVTVDGIVAASLGEPERSTFLRSTVKPIQVTACLELLADAGWPGGEPTPAEIAIAWASHRGQPEQIATVGALCQRAGISPDQLTCPPDATADGAVADRARIHHNCSGKHALFALAGSPLGCAGDALLEREGPLQTRLLERLFGELHLVDAVATDGCGAPAVRAPLSSLAGWFGRFAAQPTWARVREAGFAHPDLVGGDGRIESALLRGGTVAKLGAEGIHAAGWVADGRQIGVAVKCEDGAPRASAVVLAEIAAAAGRDLSGWQPEPATGGGRPVGGVRVAPGVLERVASALT